MRIGFRDVRLDALVEERDHLRICININKNAARPDPKSLSKLSDDLAELERHISDHKPAQRS
jgi:hypothetical protein